MASSVLALLENFEGREVFRGMLREMAVAARADRDFLTAMRIGRTLRRPDVFENIYDKTNTAAALNLLDGPRATEFGDGEFAKWFLEWFSAGGWETILAFIKALIPLFAGLV